MLICLSLYPDGQPKLEKIELTDRKPIYFRVCLRSDFVYSQVYCHSLLSFRLTCYLKIATKCTYKGLLLVNNNH